MKKQAQEAMKAKAAELQAYQTYLEAEQNSRWNGDVCLGGVMLWWCDMLQDVFLFWI